MTGALAHGVIGVLLAMAIPATVFGADDEVAALIAKPVSPGALALLLRHSNDPRASQHWRAALAHENPQVRAAAARLLQASATVSAVADLRSALSIENDEGAAIEQAQALLALAGGAGDLAVLQVVRRLRPYRFALAIAEARGQQGLKYLEEFRALKISPTDMQSIVAALVAGDRAALATIVGPALGAADENLWLAMMNIAHDEKLPLAAAQLELALSSPSPVIRDLAWWRIAIQAAEGGEVPSAALHPRSAVAPATRPELSFGRELTARALKSAPVEWPEFLARVRVRGDDFDLPEFAAKALQGPLNRLLTAAERLALNMPVPPANLTATDSAGQSVGPTSRSPFSVIRTIGELPKGFVGDVLRLTGCKPGNGNHVGGAVVRFNERRALQKLEWVGNTASKACDAAARLLILASLLPAPRITQPGEPQLVLLPLHDSFLQCLDRSREPATPAVADTRGVRVNDRVRAPTKIKEVRPVYPSSAQQAGRQGIVVLESTVSASGCVSRVQVLRSVSPDIDVAAVRSVTGWVFTPTVFQGLAVPVIMTVTVQFLLR